MPTQKEYVTEKEVTFLEWFVRSKSRRLFGTVGIGTSNFGAGTGDYMKNGGARRIKGIVRVLRRPFRGEGGRVGPASTVAVCQAVRSQRSERGAAASQHVPATPGLASNSTDPYIM